MAGALTIPSVLFKAAQRCRGVFPLASGRSKTLRPCVLGAKLNRPSDGWSLFCIRKSIKCKELPPSVVDSNSIAKCRAFSSFFWSLRGERGKEGNGLN